MSTKPNVSFRWRRARNLLLAGALLGLAYVGWTQRGASPTEPKAPLVVVAEPLGRDLDKTLRVGVNRIGFRWDADGIDAASIRLTCLEAPGEVELLGMELERGSGELTWRVFSDTAGVARFRIAYVVFE